MIRAWPPSTVLRLALANAVGYSASVASPFWISSAGARFGLPLWSGALIVSCQLACLAMLNIATPWLFRRQSTRTLSLAAALLACIGNGMAMAPQVATFIAGCALSGGALGVLLNTTNRMAAETQAPARAYATFQVVGVLFSISFLTFVPALVQRFGFFLIFMILALLCLVAALILATIDFVSEFGALQTQSDRPTGGDTAAVAIRSMALAAVFLLFVGESSLNSFLVPIGKALSLDMATVGWIMESGLVTGGILAWLLANRLGVVPAIVVGTVLLAVDVVVVTGTKLAGVYAIGVITYFVCIVFITPYLFTLLARIDRSGRTASIGPAFLMIGVSCGPSVAAFATVYVGMSAIGWIAGAAILLSTLLVVIVGWRSAAPRR